jgi:hypothetical protein
MSLNGRIKAWTQKIMKKAFELEKNQTRVTSHLSTLQNTQAYCHSRFKFADIRDWFLYSVLPKPFFSFQNGTTPHTGRIVSKGVRKQSTFNSFKISFIRFKSFSKKKFRFID